MTGSRAARRAAVVIACAVLVACFEEPVREHLHLHLAAGAVITVWTHEVEAPDFAQGNPALARRMDDSRDALARGLTPATGWFERATSAADRVTLERVDGLVRRGRWSAVVTDTRELENLLADIGLTAYLSPVEDGVELTLEPAAPARATRAQRARVDELVTDWAADVASYLAASAALYDYLDGHPERATACFTHLFEEGEARDAWPLDDDETALVGDVGDRVDAVAAALLAPSGEAFSPNELSRLVFDPFPARLTLSAASGFVAFEGLTATSAGLEREPISLWQALIGLEGLWLTPDIVTAVVAPAPDADQPDPDPAAFAARPRRWAAAPDAAEVEAELRSRLTAGDVARVTWRGPAPTAELPVDGPALLDLAEAAVPR